MQRFAMCHLILNRAALIHHGEREDGVGEHCTAEIEGRQGGKEEGERNREGVEVGEKISVSAKVFIKILDK